MIEKPMSHLLFAGGLLLLGAGCETTTPPVEPSAYTMPIPAAPKTVTPVVLPEPDLQAVIEAEALAELDAEATAFNAQVEAEVLAEVKAEKLATATIPEVDLNKELEEEILAETTDIDLNAELEAEVLAEAADVDLNAELEAEVLSELKQELLFQ
ncbi:MAG: hypothetical protein ACI9TH_000877 [Kiritimatiellia bacterium]|jgi:hypothetical protein